MTFLLPFLLRHWPMLLGGLAIALLVGLLAVRTDQRDSARIELERAEARHILFAERVRTRAEQVARLALEQARRVETQQDRISQEIAHDHENRVAELRARYERLLRERTIGARAGGAGSALGLPALPDAAGRIDDPAEPDRLSPGPGLDLAERLLCSEQSLRLLFLQSWVREQQNVEREDGSRELPAAANSRGRRSHPGG